MRKAEALIAADPVLQGIVALLGRYPNVRQACLYGSRARGDHRERSDYDLAFLFSPVAEEGEKARLFLDLQENDFTLKKIDVAFLDEIKNESLKETILREGVELIGR
ncbi:MAG: nucleotidyltransferase domain-containing protein [Deltaproteobacteria bacterium]|nr:nucleotidyltransferase domain-containing protein [Deltaproteobacteria bacterium]